MKKEWHTHDRLKLRNRAEVSLNKTPSAAGKVPPQDVRKLVEELQVHQVELELQNEDLRRAQRELEAARDRFSDLYDFAPVGYFTISYKGLIQEANLTVAAMLGVERRKLINQPFSRFITTDTQEIFYLHRKILIETKTGQSWELRLKKEDGTEFHARLECVVVEDDEGNITSFRVTVSDIDKPKQAEEALRESKEKYRALFSNAQVALFRTRSSDGKLVQINERYAKMAGYSNVEDCMAEFNAADAWANPNARNELVGILEKEGAVKDYETEIIRRDGTRLWIMFSATIFPEHGFLEGSIVDISARKQAEMELGESEEKFRTFTEMAPVGVFVTDADGLTTYWNKRLCEIAGMQVVDGLGTGWADGVHPDDRERVFKEWYESAEKRASFSCECRFVDRDGAVTYTIGQAVPLTDASMRVAGYVGTISDVTDLKRAEEALRNRTYFLQKAQEIGQIGTWDLDIKKNELLWTDENYRIFGVPIGTKLTYEIFLNCVHPDDREYVNKEWQAALNKKPYDIEHRLLVDGKVKWVREKAELHFNEKDECDRGTGVSQDITLRKHIEEQLRTSLKEKEILLSEIHHRVKNNMQVISSLLKLQSAQIEDKKYIDMFKDSENRIRSMALVHQTLYQSKDFANVDFDGYVEAITNHLIKNSVTHPDKIKLKREIEDITFGLDHAIPCGLIINELITNSLKYAFPKGREGKINITFRSINSDEIELTVSDDGIGIPEEIDIRETESLGLQLVHILAEDQLEGTLELDRDGGTAFRIRFKEAHNENSGTSISKQLGT